VRTFQRPGFDQRWQLANNQRRRKTREFNRRREKIMIKTGLSYLKWAPIAIVLVVGIASSIRPSTATNRTGSEIDLASAADLRSEEAIIAKFADDLVTYDRECGVTGKKARLVNADVEGLERKSNDLKRRLSEVQNAFREVVRKLKAANEWDNLDTTIEAGITDARERTLFREFSFKQALDEAASNLGNQASEVDEPLGTLRKRLTSRFVQGGPMMVHAGYFEPIMRVVSLRCRILSHKNAMTYLHGGHPSAQGTDQQACACNPTVSAGPNGNACAQTTQLWPVNDRLDGVRAAESQ
jgi:hypothetical protein